MKNETRTEYKYAIYHKPTQKWVQFENADLELFVNTIELVDFKDCLLVNNKDYLEIFLKRSVFNNTPNYGKDNFLEFEFVKIKTTYTIEEYVHEYRNRNTNTRTGRNSKLISS